MFAIDCLQVGDESFDTSLQCMHDKVPRQDVGSLRVQQVALLVHSDMLRLFQAWLGDEDEGLN